MLQPAPCAVNPLWKLQSPAFIGTATGSSALLPDLRGLGARDALRMLARLGLTARLMGAGVVIEQDPAAGSPIERGSVATLTLDRDFDVGGPAPATRAAP